MVGAAAHHLGSELLTMASIDVPRGGDGGAPGTVLGTDVTDRARLSRTLPAVARELDAPIEDCRSRSATHGGIAPFEDVLHPLADRVVELKMRQDPESFLPDRAGHMLRYVRRQRPSCQNPLSYRFFMLRGFGSLRLHLDG